jgi:hypothetical protein
VMTRSRMRAEKTTGGQRFLDEMEVVATMAGAG